MTYYFKGIRGISDLLIRTGFLVRMCKAEPGHRILYDLRTITGSTNDFSRLFSLDFDGLVTDPETIDAESADAVKIVLDIVERNRLADKVGWGLDYLWMENVLEFSPSVIGIVDDMTRDWPQNVCGIAARLGNGERLDPEKTKKSGRFFPLIEKFIQRADEHKGENPDSKFFVCSDSESFVKIAVETYNAFCQERFFLPDGAGGHPNALTGDPIRDAETTALIDHNGGAVGMYEDALVDMLALTKCNFIIASHWSGIPKLAEGRGVPSEVIDKPKE